MKSTTKYAETTAGELKKSDLLLVGGKTHTVTSVFTSPDSASILVRAKPEFGLGFIYLKFTHGSVKVNKAVRRVEVEMSRNEALDLLKGVSSALEGKDFSPHTLQGIQRTLASALSEVSAFSVLGSSHD